MPATWLSALRPSALPRIASRRRCRSVIYYTTFQLRARRSEYAIQYLDLASGEVKELFRKEGPFLHFALAVSPHEEWVLYCERPQSTSELMLVENFR
jgi:hypothetical protein